MIWVLQILWNFPFQEEVVYTINKEEKQPNTVSPYNTGVPNSRGEESIKY